MMKSTAEDRKWMKQALRLAEKGLGTTSPNPMVGAVIVRKGVLIGSGCHVRAGEPHAEINALRSVKGSAKGATLYVTLEPCSTQGRTPPCTKAIMEAGIARVVFGSCDPNPRHAGRAVPILEQAGIVVCPGVLKEKCDRLNECFFRWITTGMPFVILKMAETLDGKIATQTGVSQWITGPEARKQVQKLRLLADAVLVGSATYRMDHPRLTVRDAKGNVLKTPRRFVASNNRNDLVFPTGENWESVTLSSPSDWRVFLKRLGTEQACCLLLEGGGELAASALSAGVVDKIEFHIAPKLLGGRGSRTSVGGDNPASLADAVSLREVTIRKAGCDWIVSGYPEKQRMERTTERCLQV